MTLLTTTQAAAQLGISVRGVQALIASGTLRATRLGRDWAIRPADVERARGRPGRGRPRKPSKPSDGPA